MNPTVRHPLEPGLASKWLAALLVIGYAAVSLIPLVWIVMTSLRTPQDAIAYPPKVAAEVSAIGYVNLFTTRSRVSAEDQEKSYPLSRCISCCCCMEACPQFNDKTNFVGAATISQVRLFNTHPTGKMLKT